MGKRPGGSNKLFGGQKGVDFPGIGQLGPTAVTKPGLKNRKAKKGGKANSAGVGLNVIPKQPSHGFTMNKKLGQHLLKNPGIVTKIVDAASIGSSDWALEIGPGTGNLTIELCKRARRVTAIEIDPRMAAEVKKRLLKMDFSNFSIEEGDALKATFPKFDLCIANLPYQISSPFLFRLIKVQQQQKFRTAVLMFQKEFGERLLAQPGDKLYGRLAVNTQLFFRVTRVCNVAAASFNPPPKVDSIVVKLMPSKEHKIADYVQWDRMLRLLFSRKHRTIAAALRVKSNMKQLMEIHGAVRNLLGPGQGLAETITMGGSAGLEMRENHINQEITQFKEYLNAFLSNNKYSSRRVVHMSIDELKDFQHHCAVAGLYFGAPSHSGDISETLFVEAAETVGGDDDDEDEDHGMVD